MMTYALYYMIACELLQVAEIREDARRRHVLVADTVSYDWRGALSAAREIDEIDAHAASVARAADAIEAREAKLKSTPPRGKPARAPSVDVAMPVSRPRGAPLASPAAHAAPHAAPVSPGALVLPAGASTRGLVIPPATCAPPLPTEPSCCASLQAHEKPLPATPTHASASASGLAGPTPATRVDLGAPLSGLIAERRADGPSDIAAGSSSATGVPTQARAAPPKHICG